MGLLARVFAWLRRRPQQPVLDEHEAYERCHGRAEVHVVAVARPKPRLLPRLSGDHLRRCFEERLEGRGRGALGDPAERASEAVPLATGNGSRRDDPVEALSLPEALDGARRAAVGLDAGVEAEARGEARMLDRLE